MNHPNGYKANLSRLSDHLRRLSIERNFQTSPTVLQEIQIYIQEELESCGFEVRREPFLFQGQSFSNLAAWLPEGLSSPRFIIGAHFDSVPGSPGADDNASGIAALLESARLFSQSPRPGVEFVAFNLEEYGMIGSRAYVQKLKGQNSQVAGMLSLEMVGYTSKEKGSQKMPFFLKPFYPDVGNFIGLVANQASVSFLKRMEKIFRGVDGLPVESLILPGKGGIFPEARLSDHSPFWDEGYPALLVTDTSFFRNPHYHEETDTVETLDLEFIGKVTEAAARSALSSF